MDYRVYKKSISQIKHDTGHSRKTIRKALNNESWEYKKRTLQPFPILGPYLKIVNQWIKKINYLLKNKDILLAEFLINLLLCIILLEQNQL